MKNLSHKIGARSYSFQWNDPMHDTAVTVDVPSLRELDYSVWADWGPMYTYKLRAEAPIKISYNDTSYYLEQQALSIESPMLADERAAYPLFVVVEDKRKGLRISLYVTPEAELGKATIVRSHDGVKLFDLAPNSRNPAHY